MVDSEFLTPQEIAALTGYKTPRAQIDWLERECWHYFLTAAERPVVGRWYTRLRLAGVKPTANAAASAWQPDFSSLT